MMNRAAKTDAFLAGLKGARYEWGKCDCLTTCAGLAEALTGVPLSATWIARQHARGDLIQAIIESTEEYGTLAAAYHELLVAHPTLSVADGPAKPGDIVAFGGTLSIEGVVGEHRLRGPTGTMLCIRGSDGHWIMIENQRWGLAGLHRLQPTFKPRTHYRFAEI